MLSSDSTASASVRQQQGEQTEAVVGVELLSFTCVVKLRRYVSDIKG